MEITLKTKNMINYLGTTHPKLRHGYYDNWIGRKLNKDLYIALGPFEATKPQTYKLDEDCISKANNLAIKYNAGNNLGQLLVNFSRSGDINDSVALRTMLYFAANAINQDVVTNYFEPRYTSPNEAAPVIVQAVSDEQLSVFYENALNALLGNFDFLAAATLLQAPKVVKLVNTSNLNALAFEVFEKIYAETVGYKENKDSNVELSFEERVYGIFSLFSCSNSFKNVNSENGFIKEEALIECAIDALDAFDFEPSSNLEDASVYLMLSSLLETVPDLSSPKKFKNKDQHKIFKKIHSLIGKPVKITEVEEIGNTIGFSRDMVVYLNYLACQNFNIMTDKMMASKIPVSTRERLRINLVTLLENEAEIPVYLYKDITDAVYRPTSKDNNPSAVVCKFFTKTYTEKLSRNNLLFVTRMFGLNQFKEFMDDPRWVHLFNEQQVNNQVVQEQVQQGNTVQNMPSVEQGNVAQNTPPMSQGSMVQNTPPMVKINVVPNGQPASQGNVVQNTPPMNQGNMVPNTPPMTASNVVPNGQPASQGNVVQNTPPMNQGNMVPNTPPMTASNVVPNGQSDVIRDYIVFEVPNGPIALF